MPSRFIVLLATAVAANSVPAATPEPQEDLQYFTPPLSISREQIRPNVDSLKPPLGFSKEQLAHGDRVFHGEAAGGRCSTCHGWDAKGTPVGNDLTVGMYIWADGTVNGIKRVLEHNMSIAPGMDGDLKPADVDAVAAYVWALGRRGAR